MLWSVQKLSFILHEEQKMVGVRDFVYGWLKYKGVIA